MTDLSEVNMKSILVEYLKLSDKHDMAEAVEKYCDETSGIVFNKHPATNEKVFGDLIDYATSVNSGSTNTSASSFVSSKLNSIEKLLNETGKKIKSTSSVSESSYKPVKCVCRSDKEIKMSTASIEKSMKRTNNKNQKNIMSDRNEENSEYELITPEGPGTFLKFVGENYLYIQLKDGSRHCFPLQLIQYNKSYLKKHPLYSINLNYKNMALNHTINILNGKNTDSDRIKMRPTKPSTGKDKFVSFENQMGYLKRIIKQDEPFEEDTQEKDYQIHLFAKSKESKKYPEGMLSTKDPSCNPIKKNIYVHSLRNEYKLQEVTPYELIGEAIMVETEKPQNKLCC